MKASMEPLIAATIMLYTALGYLISGLIFLMVAVGVITLAVIIHMTISPPDEQVIKAEIHEGLVEFAEKVKERLREDYKALVFEQSLKEGARENAVWWKDLFYIWRK